jgi:hypothetical protein
MPETSVNLDSYAMLWKDHVWATGQSRNMQTVAQPLTMQGNRRSGGPYASTPASCPPELEEWLVDSNLKRFPNNETRGHMVSDLGRYFYAALFGRVTKVSPKAKDFPRVLAPEALSDSEADEFVSGCVKYAREATL